METMISKVDEGLAHAAGDLKRVRKLISDERKWARETFARDAFGNPVNTLDSSACSFCLAGAMGRVGACEAAFSAVLATLVLDGRSRSIGSFNDDPSVGHAGVLGVVDRTIARLEGNF